MPGVARKLYRFLGFEITFVCFLSFLSVNFPHMELRQSLASPLFVALDLMDSLSSLMPSLKKRLDIQLFVRRASYSAVIAARLSFQFLKGVYVVDEMPTLASFGGCIE